MSECVNIFVPSVPKAADLSNLSNFERALKVAKLKKNVRLNFGAFRISTIIVVITIITNSCKEGLKEQELVMNHRALMTETVIDRATRAAIKFVSEAIPAIPYKAREAPERIQLRLSSQKFPAMKLTFVTLV